MIEIAAARSTGEAADLVKGIIYFLPGQEEVFMPKDSISANVTLDFATLTGPLLAGLVLNAFYSALLLKRASGTGITPEIEEKTLSEVVLRWSKLREELNEILPAKGASQPSRSRPEQGR